MRKSTGDKMVAADYAFHFDALPERVTFSKQIKITGWLLHRRGLPIHGIRGIVRGILRRRSISRARRKRSRPLIAAAYPDLPDAGQSGFLLVLELPVGRSEITIQVQDHEKIWRTIFVAHIRAFPLTLIRRMGLPRVEQFFVAYLPQLFRENRPKIATSVISHLTAQRAASLRHDKLQTFTDKSGLTQPEIKTVHLFVTSKSNLFIREIAELLCAGFRGAGCEAQLLVDRIPAERTEGGKIQIVVTPHEFFNLFLSHKLSWEKIQRLTNHLFLLSTEQPESEWFDSNLVTAPHARAMLDIHLSGVAAYRARGLPCFHLPLGYHPLLEQSDARAKSERDLDICVLAAMTDRREEFIAANADFFAARNCHVRFVPIGFAKTEETRSYLPAPQRNALLQQTKILLNVHYSDLRYFEWHRALISIANRCCLITETCEGFEPLVPGKHFVMAKADNLTTCCEYYLKHEDEREAIAEAAYDFMRERFTQKENCRAFLQQIETTFRRQNDGAQSNFDLEANAEPTLASEPFPNALAKRLSRRPTALFLSALREDLSNMFRPANQKPAATGRRSTDTIDIPQRVTTLRNMRRGYIERFDAQEKARQSGEAIFRLLENTRFDGSAPAISVIVTLYNYRAYIRQCLKSLEDSNTTAIPGGIEVVVVNDASTDDSLKQAMAWQRISRHPVRIVDKRLNTGLADARNLGLQLARAPYAFILDADNMVFPRALEELHRTIVRDNSAAVYSILCRFEGAHNNLQGLLSYFDWDPQMLVEHPYIDAMALFDRGKLIEIGGYDTELYKFGWFGWEDYELWLRIAQAKFRVSFLPNVLCLYRHHETSMSNATNLFERELVGHLLEKYRCLIQMYPPKSRVLGVNRLRLEEAARTTSEKRKRADVSICAPGRSPQIYGRSEALQQNRGRSRPT
jgi:glycosyltransferase involved in cell wall biosynthesis